MNRGRSRRKTLSPLVVLGLLVIGEACSCPRGDLPIVEACDGSVLSWCNTQTGKCTNRDCSTEGAICQLVDAGQSACVPPPPPPCDQTYVTHCEGDFLLGCDIPQGSTTGQVVSIDCFDLYAGYYSPGWCYDAGGGNATCEYGN